MGNVVGSAIQVSSGVIREKPGRAVLVVSIGDRHQAFYSLTRPLIERYASRIGAVTLNVNSADVLPIELAVTVRNRSNRSVREPLLPYVVKYWAIHDALSRFERVLLLDSTCAVQSKCADLFELVPADAVGGWDESTMADYRSWKIDMRLAREKRGIDLPVYFNTGVIVASRCHRELFSPRKIIDNLDLFDGPYAGQLFTNVMLAQNNASVCKLRRAYNYIPIFNYADNTQRKLRMFDAAQLEIICKEGNIIHVTGYYEQRKSVLAQICHRIAAGQNLNVGIKLSSSRMGATYPARHRAVPKWGESSKREYANNWRNDYEGCSQTATALVFRDRLLRVSETFIRAQVLAMRRWRAVLVGWKLVHELPLDGIDVRILKPDLLAIKHLVEQERASLLHAHFGPDAIQSWPIARALNLPMLITLWGADININRESWEAGDMGFFNRNYPTELLKLAGQPRVRFIAVSNAIRERAISFGIPKNKVWMSYVGVDITKFVPGGPPIAERQPNVLFVGRLVEKKGCEYLIKAFSRLQQELPNACLTVIGDGPRRADLQQLSCQLSVRADFRGTVSNAEVAQELQRTKVFCVPSVRAVNGDAEGLAICLLEAQASGVPVVTSGVPSAAEAIEDGVTGFLFEERDVETLANRLVRLITDNTLATSMSLAGPRFIRNKFDLNRCTERLEVLYDRMISDAECLASDQERSSLEQTLSGRTPEREQNAAASNDPAGESDGRVAVRRNELCPCGSGRRYKHCHGRF